MPLANFILASTSLGAAHDSDFRVVSSESSSGFAGPFQILISAYYGATEALQEEVLHETGGIGNEEIAYVAGGNGGYSVPIPKDSEGDYKAGWYRFEIQMYDEDTASVVRTDSFYFNYIPGLNEGETVTEDLEFAATYDCATGLITATDTTDNEAWGANDPVGRTITVTIPPTIQEPAPSPLEESSTDLSIDPVFFPFSYTNAPYQVSLSLFRNRNLDVTVLGGDIVTVLQQEGLFKTITLDIECGTGAAICDIAACVEAKYVTAEAKACGGGGWGNLGANEKADLEHITVLNTIRQLYLSCGNYNKAGEFEQKLVDITGCGCGCDDTGQPVPYTPPGV